jgi:hypothetical protein
VGNALVVITWVVTRSVGALVGPAATTPERPGFGDLVAMVIQVFVVVGCLILLSWRPVRAGWWAEQARVIAALAVMPFLVPALYSAVGGSPFVSMVG